MIRDHFVRHPVEGGGSNFVTERPSRHTEVDLKQLTEVHTAWHAHRAEQNVNRRPVFHKRHIFHRQNPGYDTFVTVATGDFVTDADFAHLGHVNPNLHQHAGFELMALFAGIDPHADHLTGGRAIHADRGVADVLSFLTEDGAEQTFLRAELLLTLRGDFTDQDVARLNFGTHDHDTVFTKVAQTFLGNVRDVASDLLGSEFSLAHFHIKVLDVDGGELVVFHQAGRNHDGVIHIITTPGHKGYQEVFTER